MDGACIKEESSPWPLVAHDDSKYRYTYSEIPNVISVSGDIFYFYKKIIPYLTCFKTIQLSQEHINRHYNFFYKIALICSNDPDSPNYIALNQLKNNDDISACVNWYRDKHTSEFYNKLKDYILTLTSDYLNEDDRLYLDSFKKMLCDVFDDDEINVLYKILLCKPILSQTYSCDMLQTICILTDTTKERLYELEGKLSALFKITFLFRESNSTILYDMLSQYIICKNDKLSSYEKASKFFQCHSQYHWIYNTSEYDLSTFNVDKQTIALLKKILKNKKSNILIYGKSGIGKTEFAKSLLKKMHYNRYLVIENNITNKNFLNYIDELNRAFRLLNCDIPILFDECDNILNVPSFKKDTNDISKSELNTMLDDSCISGIWITNYIDCIDESVLRRFDYILKLEESTGEQNYKLWKNIYKLLKIEYVFKGNEFKDIVKDYQLTPAYIALTLKNVILIHQQHNKKNFLYHLKKYLESNFTKTTKEDSFILPVKQYNLNSLNINYNPNDIINSVKRYNKNTADMPMSILFSGNPGTGKTEFAKEIARQTKLPLLIKRYSDISSCYVGETEKNIAKLFEQANEKNAILLIDECDSLMQSRSNAQRSWEVTQVNELLTQMETYRGVIIMSTNFLADIDNAAMRRFCWKVKFNNLTTDAKELMYKKYFNKKDLSDCAKRKLEKIDLTFGDFKAVSSRIKMINSKQKENDIIKELEEEITYKQNSGKIGF